MLWKPKMPRATASYSPADRSEGGEDAFLELAAPGGEPIAGVQSDQRLCKPPRCCCTLGRARRNLLSVMFSPQPTHTSSRMVLYRIRGAKWRGESGVQHSHHVTAG